MEKVFALFIVFQTKHFITDFLLQTPYMLRKERLSGWVLPLLSHALVHALFTLGIILVVNKSLWWLAIVDLVVHFSVDRIKASPHLLNRFKISEKYFWWVLGADQMSHHLTHYWIIWMLVTTPIAFT